MKYNITFYCPDRHIRYNGGRLPDSKGVGGGVTVRIRMANALASRGHKVSMICNCIRDEFDGDVHYIPLDNIAEIETDVLILTTSGDGLNLHPISNMAVNAKLIILLAHGVEKPQGLEQIPTDYFYAISRFIKGIMLNDWKVPSKKIFISYHGVTRESFQQNRKSEISKERNPFRLAYLGHPQKGRKASIGVLRSLRNKNTKYHLHLFGDERLWGTKAKMVWGVKGLKNFGLINQRKLAKELLSCNFGIFLQSRQEPFGLTIIEAMAAGCIPIASSVGAFSEIIQNGKNGYLIEGTHDESSTWERAADLIHELQTDPVRLEILRTNAQNWPLDWMDVAKTWEQHWDIVLGNRILEKSKNIETCSECQSELFEFPDGFHCLSCGNFVKDIQETI